MNKYERMYWRYAFSCMDKHDRKRVKTLLRRRALLRASADAGRQPHRVNYWQWCTGEINDILMYGSAHWSR